MDSFQIKLQDSLKILYLSNCENPFKRILIFPTHLIVLEYGAFYFSFKKEGGKTSESAKVDNCKDITIEMGSGKECFFENTSITNAYTQLINSKEIADSKYLLKVLPKSNQLVKVDDKGLISIEYKWQNSDQLLIEFFYNGGSTDIKLNRQGDGVLRGIYKYAD
ncbi:MAG TPA: hypothetical protein VF677_06420 [Flavobacterium sp.]|jgi:hypothetical protein